MYAFDSILKEWVHRVSAYIQVRVKVIQVTCIPLTCDFAVGTRCIIPIVSCVTLHFEGMLGHWVINAVWYAFLLPINKLCST